MSSKDPLGFYNVNIQGTLILLRCMTKHNIRTLMFSSSSTVYGDVTETKMLPVAEECPLAPVNTYGHTKVMGEIIIKSVFDAKNREEQAAGSGKVWNAGLLRYFNPCGAHPSGVLGEDPRGGLHLIPVLAQIALGKIPSLGIWGDGTSLSRNCKAGKALTYLRDLDYKTHDGTMVRDYIHVSDLARGHIAALNYLQSVNPGVRAWNFGSGRGVSVLDALKAFSRVVGRDLPSTVSPRKPEYVADLTSDSSRAERELKWKAVQTLDDCCADFWRWTTKNPEGYMQEAPEELVKALKESI